MMAEKRGVIIAMQGDPFTGKTFIANILGRILKYTTIRLDDILEFIAPDLKSPQPPEKTDALFTLAFNLLTQIVKTQTSLGIPVIVDSPLSRRSHLDKLVSLVADSEEGGAHLIIIQCKPETPYMWETRFEQHSGSIYKNKWYKPQEWPITNEFLSDYTDEHIPPRLVSKLVVNTTAAYVPDDPLVAAVTHLISAREVRTVQFQTWLQSQDISPPLYKRKHRHLTPLDGRPSKRVKVLRGFCKDGHFVKEYQEEGSVNRLHSGTCEVCDEKIDIANSGAAYTCSDCPLAIHKSCAELEGKGSSRVFTPQGFPEFLQRKLHKTTYCFPEQHLCILCTKEAKEFSYECGSCIFQSHLKCRLFPTILHHDAHVQHWLYFWVRPISFHVTYECHACRKHANFVGFSCMDGCVNYHPECAFLPRVFEKHKHCGYTHDLYLVFHRKEKLDDYICHRCFETMNPDAWYYTCKNCSLDMHLDCAFEEFDNS